MKLLCNYYVTYRCNASCEFCHFADHDFYKNFSQASLVDFKRNVDDMAKLGVKFIDLTGGEPLLNTDIVEMVRYAKSKGMQTSITTNALLYAKYAKELSGYVDLLHFSLDSPYEDVHNKIRKVNCFNSVFEAIELAKSLGEHPDILFTVTDNSYLDLPEMHAIAKRNKLILIVNPVFSYFNNPGLSDKSLSYIEKYSKSHWDVYLNPAFIKLRREGGNNISKPLCKAVSRVIVISPENEIILPCYHFKQENIKITTSISEIIKSEKYIEFEKMEGRFEFCQGCTVNCYFEPSFAFPTNIYGLKSIPSKLKYGFTKLVLQKLSN